MITSVEYDPARGLVYAHGSIVEFRRVNGRMVCYTVEGPFRFHISMISMQNNCFGSLMDRVMRVTQQGEDSKCDMFVLGKTCVPVEDPEIDDYAHGSLYRLYFGHSHDLWARLAGWWQQWMINEHGLKQAASQKPKLRLVGDERKAA